MGETYIILIDFFKVVAMWNWVLPLEFYETVYLICSLPELKSIFLLVFLLLDVIIYFIEFEMKLLSLSPNVNNKQTNRKEESKATKIELELIDDLVLVC